MATVNPTQDRNTANGMLLAAWTLGGADTGTPITVPYAADITAQVSGTFGAATVVVEGSNDGTNWYTLNAVVGSTLSFTTAGLRKAVESPAFVRASSSGGTGSALTVTLAIKAQFQKVGY